MQSVLGSQVNVQMLQNINNANIINSYWTVAYLLCSYPGCEEIIIIINNCNILYLHANKTIIQF